MRNSMHLSPGVHFKLKYGGHAVVMVALSDCCSTRKHDVVSCVYFNDVVLSTGCFDTPVTSNTPIHFSIRFPRTPPGFRNIYQVTIE